MESPLILAEKHTTNYTNIVYLDKAGSMEARTFCEQIIRPALKVTNLWSPSAEALLLGTALVESNLNSVIQIGGGPALSWFQIEKATYADCIRYLNTTRAKNLKASILAACYMDTFPEAESLKWNLRLATLIARVKYWMIEEPLPDSKDFIGLYNYYEKYYNAGGKATAERGIPHFAIAVEK